MKQKNFDDELSNEELLNLGNSTKVDEPIKMHSEKCGTDTFT